MSASFPATVCGVWSHVDNDDEAACKLAREPSGRPRKLPNNVSVATSPIFPLSSVKLPLTYSSAKSFLCSS